MSSIWIDDANKRWRFSSSSQYWEVEDAPGVWVVSPLPGGGLSRQPIMPSTINVRVIETMGPRGPSGPRGLRGERGLPGAPGISSGDGSSGEDDRNTWDPKDPADVADYWYSWTEFLPDEVFISDTHVEGPGDIDVVETDFLDKIVRARFGDGIDGEDYPMDCTITTNDGQVFKQTSVLLVRERVIQP